MASDCDQLPFSRRHSWSWVHKIECRKWKEAAANIFEWLDVAEGLLCDPTPVPRILYKVSAEIDMQGVFEAELNKVNLIMSQLDRRGGLQRDKCFRPGDSLIKDLIHRVQLRWENVVFKSTERSKALDIGFRQANYYESNWRSLMSWLSCKERALDDLSREIAHSVNNLRKLRYLKCEHLRTQLALEAKKGQYDSVAMAGNALRDNAPESDVTELNEKEIAVKELWNTVVSKTEALASELDQVIENCQKVPSYDKQSSAVDGQQRLSGEPTMGVARLSSNNNVSPDDEAIINALENYRATCQCESPLAYFRTSEGQYQIGDDNMARDMNVYGDQIWVFADDWISLEEHVFAHDPCRGQTTMAASQGGMTEDDNMIIDVIENYRAYCACDTPFDYIRTADGLYQIGDDVMPRYISVYEGGIMAYVDDVWVTLDEHISAHDPCRSGAIAYSALTDDEMIINEIERLRAYCQCEVPFTYEQTPDGLYLIGDDDIPREVAVYDSQIWVVVDDEWVELENHVYLHDPCRGGSVSYSAMTEDEMIIDEIERYRAYCECEVPFTYERTSDGLYQIGEDDEPREIAYYDPKWWVNVDGSWVDLEEHIFANDPCRGSRTSYDYKVSAVTTFRGRGRGRNLKNKKSKNYGQRLRVLLSENMGFGRKCKKVKGKDGKEAIIGESSKEVKFCNCTVSDEGVENGDGTKINGKEVQGKLDSDRGTDDGAKSPEVDEGEMGNAVSKGKGVQISCSLIEDNVEAKLSKDGVGLGVGGKEEDDKKRNKMETIMEVDELEGRGVIGDTAIKTPGVDAPSDGVKEDAKVTDKEGSILELKKGDKKLKNYGRESKSDGKFNYGGTKTKSGAKIVDSTKSTYEEGKLMLTVKKSSRLVDKGTKLRDKGNVLKPEGMKDRMKLYLVLKEDDTGKSKKKDKKVVIFVDEPKKVDKKNDKKDKEKQVKGKASKVGDANVLKRKTKCSDDQKGILKVTEAGSKVRISGRDSVQYSLSVGVLKDKPKSKDVKPKISNKELKLKSKCSSPETAGNMKKHSFFSLMNIVRNRKVMIQNQEVWKPVRTAKKPKKEVKGAGSNVKMRRKPSVFY